VVESLEELSAARLAALLDTNTPGPAD